MTHAPTDARLHNLDRFVRHSLRTRRAPGVAVGVIERGRVIHAKGYGVCDCRRRARRPPPERLLRELAGEYVHPGYGRVLVTRSGAALTLEYNGVRAPLLHERGDVFRISGVAAQVPRWEPTFRVNQAGRVVSVAIHMEPTVAPVVFRKRIRR